MKDYEKFLADKALFDEPTGIKNPSDISTKLFDFQKDMVRWALRRGRAAIFADYGAIPATSYCLRSPGSGARVMRR